MPGLTLMRRAGLGEVEPDAGSRAKERLRGTTATPISGVAFLAASVLTGTQRLYAGRLCTPGWPRTLHSASRHAGAPPGCGVDVWIK